MAHSYERLPIDELQRFADSKGDCIFSEAAGGNQDATVCAFCGDNAQELPDTLDGNLPIQPVLALDHDALAATGKLKVNSAIGLRSATLDDGKALPTVGFPDKPLKLCPIELAYGFEAVRPRQ